MKKIVRADFEKKCYLTTNQPTTNYYGSDSMGPGDGVTGPKTANIEISKSPL